MIARALLFVAVLVSSAAAQDGLGEGGPAVWNGDGTLIESNTHTFNFADGDFTGTTQASGEVLIQAGPDLRQLSDCNGDLATDQCNPTIMFYDVVGGTAATDSLSLRPNSNANPTTGTIELCGGVGDSDTTAFACLTPFPDGWTIGPAGGVTGGATVLRFNSTVTQDSSGLAGFPWNFVFDDNHTHSISGSTTAGTSLFSFRSQPIYVNPTANAVSGASIYGLYFNPILQNTGSGSLTIAAEYGLYVDTGARQAGTTVTDRYGIVVLDAVTSGTITDNYGVFVRAQTVGTNRFPYGAGEHTITGTVNTGEGVWGVESGSPNRFYTKNESGQIHRMGYATSTGSGVAMNTGATHYFPINDRLTTTATEGNTDVPVPGAITVYHVACGVDVAPDTGGGVQSWTFTVSADTADVTGTSCAIADTATSCTASIAAGTSVAAGVMWNWQVVPSGTPTASDGTCTVWWNLNAF
jgi:hypothetical protein